MTHQYNGIRYRHVKTDNDGHLCGSMQSVHNTRSNEKLFISDCETLRINEMCIGSIKGHE